LSPRASKECGLRWPAADAPRNGAAPHAGAR
jgi:hypothetical protein